MKVLITASVEIEDEKEVLNLLKKLQAKYIKSDYEEHHSKGVSHNVISLSKLIEIAKNSTDIEFICKNQKREKVQERQICMYLADIFTDSSLATIGEELGGKDHATVLHAKKTISNLLDMDIKVRDKRSTYILDRTQELTNLIMDFAREDYIKKQNERQK